MRRRLQAFAIAGLVCAPISALAQPRSASSPPGAVAWEVGPDRGVRGHIITAALESEDRVLLATGADLHLVRGGKAEVIATPPAADAQLVLAPGGRVYGYLLPLQGSRQLFGAQLRFTDGSHVVDLPPRSERFGFGALWLGFQGRLIVTVTPVADWRGLRGPFRYTFWSADGRVLREFERADRGQPAFDPKGEAILLLEPGSAIAFDATGERLWEVQGRFRKGAIARAGAVALLNPAKEIREIVTAGKDLKSTRLTLETPVHHLALSPDGATGFAAGDRGTYAFFDPARPRLEPRRVPLPDNPYVFDVQFLDKDAVALGLLHRSGERKSEWPRGSWAALDRKGKLRFARTVDVEQPATDQIDVGTLYGSPWFVGFTDSRALLARAVR